MKSIDTVKEKGIGWFASVWDKDSVDFMKSYTTQFSTNFNGQSDAVVMKIPSALITDMELSTYAKENSDFLIISTGMSNELEVEQAITTLSPDVIMHTNSTYPTPVEELNLDYLRWLKQQYRYLANWELGYSGHEFGLMTTVAATLLGAVWVERHYYIRPLDVGF